MQKIVLFSLVAILLSYACRSQDPAPAPEAPPGSVQPGAKRGEAETFSRMVQSMGGGFFMIRESVWIDGKLLEREYIGGEEFATKIPESH